MTRAQHRKPLTAADRAAAATRPGARPRHPFDHPREEDTLPTPGQRHARAKALARPARDADPTGAESRIASYVCADPHARPHTALIRDLVRAAAPTDAADAAELLSAVSGHAAWLSATGQPVTASTVLDPDRTLRWVLVGLTDLSAGTTANYRSRIARVAVAAGARDPRSPMQASDAAEAYTPREEDDLVAWAAGQRTPAMRTGLLAVACTGLGMALGTSEILAATGTDLRVDPDGLVTCRVRGTRPRTVPARARYRPLLTDLAAAAGSAHLVRPGAPGRGGKNSVGNLVARAREGGDPRLPVLTPQRMRATWLARQLRAGVRVDAVMAAAGLDSAAVLDRYLRRLPPAPPGLLLDAVARSDA